VRIPRTPLPKPVAARIPEEGIVSGADLLVLAPWVVFAVGVITLIVLAFARGVPRGPGGKPTRRHRSRQRDR
jgi:hypothetical protein